MVFWFEDGSSYDEPGGAVRTSLANLRQKVRVLESNLNIRLVPPHLMWPRAARFSATPRLPVPLCPLFVPLVGIFGGKSISQIIGKDTRSFQIQKACADADFTHPLEPTFLLH